METINNVVNSASKAIWGDQNTATTTGNETGGKEPVSGLQGKGTPTEPYDQGNAATPNEPVGKTDPFNSTSTTKAENDLPKPASTETPKTTSTDLPIHTKSDGTSKPHIPINPTSAATGGEPKPLQNTEGTGVTGTTQKFAPKGGDVIPSESSSNPGAAPASGAAPTTKQQGADRPSEGPTDKKEDSPDDILKKRDPNDHSGEPMKMHNGPDTKVPTTQEERRESKVGNPGGQHHGEEPKGTGEQWTKTSGLQADGGDFDATKPGAGKEADRLLEEKGIHRDGKGNMDSTPPASTGSGSADKEKVSKMEKIKEKLHIGHKDK
ncbi:hypothetical protein CC80DRAFT_542634 [Byssothecium circinans]|uniref:Glycine-rich cell wall structural protein 1 n=1 Tax=Byssothecium circinans TaxID=147558 RepID=A0A6A5UC54_9PLEO|nr:hypothetical protein CC80DRAFT_542634 [Byssothecium circinans]